MSFLFSWMDLCSMDLKSSVNEVLSRFASEQPTNQRVHMKKLLLGDSPPVFELLDIVELKEERFKGLFKFQYEGELEMTLQSDIEINSLRLIDFDSFTRPRFVLADKSTILPVDFDLKKVKIDAILTVVYNGKNITVVFNDAPLIDLDIETSIDELLDEELFETMKTDALMMATEFLRQDLPGMISQLKLFEEPMESMENMSVSSKPQQQRTSFVSVPGELTTLKNDYHVFDTLSLKPQGFTDVIQRISLSHAEYQQLQQSPRDYTHKAKRRNIKMKTKRTKRTATPPAATPTTLPPPRTKTPEPISITTSQSSSPTLMDTTFSSVEDYVMSSETLVFNDTTCDDELLEDPYADLIHPMDILPCYENEKDIKHLIPETKMRPRGASSNYKKFEEPALGFWPGRKAESDVMTL